MRVDFTLINPTLSIPLNLADRVLGLAPSKEFSSWLNLVCLPFTIFLIIRIVFFVNYSKCVINWTRLHFNFVRWIYYLCHGSINSSGSSGCFHRYHELSSFYIVTFV